MGVTPAFEGGEIASIAFKRQSSRAYDVIFDFDALVRRRFVTNHLRFLQHFLFAHCLFAQVQRPVARSELLLQDLPP